MKCTTHHDISNLDLQCITPFVSYVIYEEASRCRVSGVPSPVIVIGLAYRTRKIRLEARKLDYLGWSIGGTWSLGNSAGAGARDSSGTACRWDVRRESSGSSLYSGRVGVAKGRRRRNVISERSQTIILIAL